MCFGVNFTIFICLGLKVTKKIKNFCFSSFDNVVEKTLAVWVPSKITAYTGEKNKKKTGAHDTTGIYEST